MSDDAAIFAGGCACGAVRYQATAEPINPHYCHCRMCRRSVGAPVVAWVNFPQAAFTWMAEKPTWFASSSGMRRGSCAHCGSSICTVEDDGYVCVTIASLDRDEAVVPRYHIYARHGLPWFVLDDGQPREHREDRA